MSKYSLRAFCELMMLLAVSVLLSAGLGAAIVPQSDGCNRPAKALEWQSPARLHHGLLRAAPGTLIFNQDGIEFHADESRFSQRWLYAEIETFTITRRRLTITGYQNRGHYLPGDRRYHFELRRRVPPAVAAQLAELVAKPGINADPALQEEGFATVPARHRTLSGGTNGTLQFSRHGITYVTARGEGGRSWRWADIETIARPDAYHFTVGGYRETFEFELEQPMAQTLFDRLWNFVYGRGLQLGEGRSSRTHSPDTGRI